MICRCNNWLDSLNRFIMSLALIFDISNIARVAISNIVRDNLSATIWKSNFVFSIGGIPISVLIGSKVGTRVVIGYGITILVNCWPHWFSCFVCHDWGRVVDRGWLCNNHGSWFVNDHRGWLVGRGRLVQDWCSMVDWGMDWGMDWHMGWCMDSSGVFLSSIWVVHVLWSSMGLAGNNSSIRTVGLVDRVADSWRIAMLDDLVMGLITSGNSQQGRDSSKGLKEKI